MFSVKHRRRDLVNRLWIAFTAFGKDFRCAPDLSLGAAYAVSSATDDTAPTRAHLGIEQGFEELLEYIKELEDEIRLKDRGLEKIMMILARPKYVRSNSNGETAFHDKVSEAIIALQELRNTIATEIR